MKNSSFPLPKLLLVILGLAFIAGVVTALTGAYWYTGLAFVTFFGVAAVYFQLSVSWKTFAFTCWVFAFFLASLVVPEVFLVVGGFDQRTLIVPLIQVIMFGMGATLSLHDFSNALKMPKAVIIGMLLQFSVMPLVGWGIAYSFGFEPELAAGIILIGSCPGGVASNVMTYLAKGNVALSVSMTACSTIMAPFITPVAMKVLAGRLIEIEILTMLLSIVNLIILPVAGGLVTHYLLHSNLRGSLWRPLAVVAAILCFVLAKVQPTGIQQLYSLAAGLLLMSVLRRSWLERGLPVVSMAGICYIVAIIAASTRNQILEVGIALFVAAILHNSLGYLFGYSIARASRLPESDCRTVALEVGMQNGGMGSALAMNVLKSSTAALGSVIFGTWMNLSGSVLASWWKGNPPKGVVEQSD